MRNGDLTYDDFLQRLNIQDILIDAGYHLNKRDGLRYPSYVRMDSEGRRIRGDKFIVMPNGKCCFKAQEQKVYNIISFIKEYPQFCGIPGRSISGPACQSRVQPVAEPSHRGTQYTDYPAETGRETVRHNGLRDSQVQPSGQGYAEEVLSFLQTPWNRPLHAVCLPP